MGSSGQSKIKEDEKIPCSCKDLATHWKRNKACESKNCSVIDCDKPIKYGKKIVFRNYLSEVKEYVIPLCEDHHFLDESIEIPIKKNPHAVEYGKCRGFSLWNFYY